MGIFGHSNKPWLRRDYNKKTFTMNVNYIIKHLDPYDKHKVEGSIRFLAQKLWQSKKEKAILRELKAGIDPSSLIPARLVLHRSKEEFRVEDGISKLRAFRKRRIKKISVELRVGEW